MTRVTVNHPIFRSVGYDAEDLLMEVSFRDGSVMLYRGVPMKLYNDFMRASKRKDLDMPTFYRLKIEGQYSGREVKSARALA